MQEAPVVSASPAVQSVLSKPLQASGPVESSAPSQDSPAQRLQQLPAPVQAPGQAQGPASTVRQMPVPLDGTALSHILASYHTGQTSTAGRPVLAMGPLLNTHASDALPLLGAGLPGLQLHPAS